MAQTFDDFVPDVGGLALVDDERVVDCERWLLIGVSGRVVCARAGSTAFRQLIQLEPLEPDLDAERTKRHKLLMDGSQRATHALRSLRGDEGRLRDLRSHAILHAGGDRAHRGQGDELRPRFRA